MTTARKGIALFQYGFCMNTAECEGDAGGPLRSRWQYGTGQWYDWKVESGTWAQWEARCKANGAYSVTMGDM